MLFKYNTTCNADRPRETYVISNVNCTEIMRPKHLRFAVSGIAAQQVYVVAIRLLKQLLFDECIIDMSYNCEIHRFTHT